jgi:hypothetical protein
MSRSQTARSQDILTYLPSNPNALSFSTIILFIYLLLDPIEDSETNMKKIYYWKDQTPTFHRTRQARSRAAHDHVSEVDARQHVTGCKATCHRMQVNDSGSPQRCGIWHWQIREEAREKSGVLAYPQGLFNWGFSSARLRGIA